jgi:hypothetical protein
MVDYGWMMDGWWMNDLGMNAGFGWIDNGLL